MLKRMGVVGAAALLSGACAEGPKNTTDDFGYNGTGIAFKVAPLTLDALDDACYSFAVVSQLNQLVVGRGPSVTAGNLPTVTNAPVTATTGAVCASQFGNAGGGDISYVAPCDASEDAKNHTVHLWVNALCRDGGATQNTGVNCDEIQDYINPCPTVGGCSLNVVCAENQDTPVVFNFTIMGQADQGFFDIAVNFDNVFCSAKLDDCNTLNQPIRLVFDPISGARIRTGVAAVACTAGADTATADVTTMLLMSALTVTCDDGAGGTISGTFEFGNVSAEGNIDIGPFPGMLTFGTEMLPNVNKVYTTVSVGIGAYTNCDFEWRVAPVKPDFVDAWGQENTWNSHGYVEFDGGDLGGADTLCHTHPMNESGSAVNTAYVDSTNAGALASSWTAVLAQGSTAFGTVSFGSDDYAGAACSVPEAEHPRYTTIARDVALCGNNYTAASIGDACGAGWEVCRYSQWQARYPAGGVDPQGWVSSWGADQNVRCLGGIWEANTPYDANTGDYDPVTGQNGITWNDSLCGDTDDGNEGPYNPWNNGKYLFDDDGVTILEGSGNCCDWDATFSVPVVDEDSEIWGAIYCCRL